MRESEILIGARYRNARGGTERTVVNIGPDHCPPTWYGSGLAPGAGVLYREDGPHLYRVFLSTFAKWAGTMISHPNGKIPQLTSDQLTRLDKWTAKEERDLRDAEDRIAKAKVRRALAQQRVSALLEDMGFVGSAADIFIARAEEVRDALAPFDSGQPVGAPL